MQNKPLILHVIDNLKSLVGIKGIAVSTDSNEIISLCKNVDNIVTLEKEKKLSDDKTGFADLIKHDVPRYSKYFNCNTFILCLPTAVLVRTIDFQNAIDNYKKINQGILIAGVKYKISPFLAIEKKNHHIRQFFQNITVIQLNYYLKHL